MALSIFKDIPFRTRRALLLYKVNGDNALLVLNGTSLNSDSALLSLNSQTLLNWSRFSRFRRLFWDRIPAPVKRHVTCPHPCPNPGGQPDLHLQAHPLQDRQAGRVCWTEHYSSPGRSTNYSHPVSFCHFYIMCVSLKENRDLRHCVFC